MKRKRRINTRFLNVEEINSIKYVCIGVPEYRTFYVFGVLKQ